jgi:hypothetical protein
MSCGFVEGIYCGILEGGKKGEKRFERGGGGKV